MQLKKSKHKPVSSAPEPVLNIPFDFQATGTRWRVTLPVSADAAKFEPVKQQVLQRVDQFEQHYSRFRTDSLVSQLQQQTGNFLFPSDFTKMWKLYQKLSQLSNGAFTPFIGSLLVQAGYDPSYSLVTKQLNTPKSWDSVSYSEPYLATKEPVTLDFGAAGKGYLVDIVAEILLKAGINDFLIDAGGDLLQRNSNDRPAAVGLEHPLNTTQAIGIAQLNNKSLCGSAGNRRHWGNFHHITNPKTLNSPRETLATWVIADSTIVADALATCLFFAPPAIFSSDFSFEYAIVAADLSLQYSKNFPANFFE